MSLSNDSLKIVTVRPTRPFRIGNGGFTSVVNKMPLTIEHINTFANISFWGWIVGTGLRVPAALLGIANGFIQLYKSLKGLSVLNLTNIIGFLTNPVILGGIAITSIFTGTVRLATEFERAITPIEKRIEGFREKIARETEEFNKDIKEKLTFELDNNFKTGFEKIPTEFYAATDEVKQSVETRISELQTIFKTRFAELWNGFEGKEFLRPRIEELINTEDFDKISEILGQKIAETAKKVSELRKTIHDEYKKAQAEYDNNSDKKAAREVLDKAYQQRAEKIKQLTKLEKELKKNIENSLNGNNANFKQIYQDVQKTANDISDVLAKQLNEALYGNQEAYKKLAPDMQKVVDLLKETGANASQTAEDFNNLIASAKTNDNVIAITSMSNNMLFLLL